MPVGDQEAVTAFLSQSTGYAPQSGEIIGILKQMGDEMAASVADATSTEKAAITSYEGLMAAKKKEVAALTATVEAKTAQIGELGVAIVGLKDDLADAKETLGEDQAFLGDLKKDCGTKTAEWEARSKTRSEELVALADTIKVLNDDDALELFKQTLPSASASLLQVESGRSSALATVRTALQKANTQDRPGLEFLVLALTGKQSAGAAGFAKVVKMIDNMVGILGKEQTDDDDKKEYCAAQFDSSDDTKKALEHAIAGEEAAVATATDAIATLTSEIAALTASIKALDKSVTDATAQRKDENAECKALIASNTAASQLLGFAKNRLNKFYNPKLYKPPAKTELSAGDRIYENEGGVIATAAPGGIAGTGIAMLAQVSAHKQRKAAPAAPPATWGAYATKSSENTGVIAMIDLLVADLTKEMTEAETDEKDAEADYKQLMKDSAAKRTTDAKALTSKGAAKADMESDLQAHKGSAADGKKELMATEKYIASLHAECDWLLQYFDARQAARTGEIESLKQAKAVLSGADYSLLQQTVRRAGVLAKKDAPGLKAKGDEDPKFLAKKDAPGLKAKGDEDPKFLAKKNVCSVEGRSISADMTTQHEYYSQAGGGKWTFKGKGRVVVVDGVCPQTDDFPQGGVSHANGGASESKDFECKAACCVRFCCGAKECWSS